MSESAKPMPTAAAPHHALLIVIGMRKADDKAAKKPKPDRKATRENSKR